MTWISYQCFTLAPRRVFCFSRVPYGTAGLHGVFFNLWSQGHITIMIVLTASTAPVRRWTHSLAVNVIISESRVGTGRESDELWISPSGHPRPESCPLASKKKKSGARGGKKHYPFPVGDGVEQNSDAASSKTPPQYPVTVITQTTPPLLFLYS